MPDGEPSPDPQGISHRPDTGGVFEFHWHCKAISPEMGGSVL